MFLSELKGVNTFIFDVDGVYTNGKILVSENGELLRSMDIKDGYATKKAVDQGLKLIVISGGNSLGVKIRFEKLGLTEIHLGVSDKVQLVQKMIAEGKVDPLQTVYMGDDMPDLKAMQLVYLKTAPADAIPEILTVADYVSPYKGGEGCVRDLLEKTLKIQGLWG
jgi:3-deoxy-D-manno-octulosonate 8-phosphate phosphatase (KDO 8-P phosphatase)